MSSIEFTIRTLRLRLKDKHRAFLCEQARAVNFVWNYCNELSYTHWQRKREFFSAYAMQPYTKGAGLDPRQSQRVELPQRPGLVWRAAVVLVGLLRPVSVRPGQWLVFVIMITSP